MEWLVPTWAPNDMREAQRTPDLACVLQEMVSRPGWTTNSAPAFVMEGTGQRIADALENPVGTAAVLRVTWALRPEPLRVEYASSVGNPNRVVLKFDRQVSETTAEMCGNYRLRGGVEVYGAALGSEGDLVRLTGSGMTTGRVYRLTVKGVTDLSVPVKYVAMEAESVFTCLGCPVQFVRKDDATRGSWRGMYHPDIAWSRNNLAISENELGNLGEAEKLQTRAIAIREKSLGPEHPYVAESLVNQAIVYNRLGKLGQAEALYRRALAIFETALGPDHPYVAESLFVVGETLEKQHRFMEALPLLERARAIRSKAAVEPKERATTAFALARVLWAMGKDRTRARSLAQEALELYQAAGAGTEKERQALERWFAEHWNAAS